MSGCQWRHSSITKKNNKKNNYKHLVGVDYDDSKLSPAVSLLYCKCLMPGVVLRGVHQFLETSQLFT